MYMYTKILRLRERWKYQRWEITSLSAPGLSPPQPGTKGPGEGPQSPFYRGRILHEPLYLSLSTKKKLKKNDKYCQQYSQPLFWGINIANTYVYPPTEWLGPMNWPHQGVLSFLRRSRRCFSVGFPSGFLRSYKTNIYGRRGLYTSFYVYIFEYFNYSTCIIFLQELISDFSSAKHHLLQGQTTIQPPEQCC